MKKRLSDFFIKRAVNNLAKVSFGRKHCFRSLKEAHDIVVFYEAKDKEEVEPGLETLRMLKKNVYVCVYSTGQDVQEDASAYLVIHDNENKDINLWGFPSSEIIDKVNTLKADLLIDLTGKSCYPMKYLLLQHPSQFKTGIKRGENDMYDFSIAVTDRNELMYLFGQIIFYLQTIRSK